MIMATDSLHLWSDQVLKFNTLDRWVLIFLSYGSKNPQALKNFSSAVTKISSHDIM